MADSGVNGEKIIEAVKETLTALAEKNLPILVHAQLDARLAEMDAKIAQIAERVAVRTVKA